MPRMKDLVILGSTGSIGTQALDVAQQAARLDAAVQVTFVAGQDDVRFPYGFPHVHQRPSGVRSGT
mgnify:CR=1 FL=1